MTFAAACQTVLMRLRAFARHEQGLSAVEFAMVAPLMITLYLGTVEVSQGVSAQRKVTLAARTVADLVAQSSKLTSSDVSDLLKASTAVLSPLSATNAGVTVSSVAIDAQGRATIAWSQATGSGQAHGVGSSVALPTTLAIANSSLIWGEVHYNYNPTFGYVLTSSLDLHDQMYMRPRIGDSVVCTGC